MKIEIYTNKGESLQDVEDKLEKAVTSKIKKREQAYAKESYHNDHLDQFHEMITKTHKSVLEDIMTEVNQVLEHHLGVRNVSK